MIDKMLSTIKKEYRLRSLNSGVFHKLVVRGMDFEINSFEAVGIGRVATMCASGLAGLMKREILVISPMEKDAAVITYERVKAFGKDTVILARYTIDEEPVFVKKSGRKKQSVELDQEAENYLNAYMAELKEASVANATERRAQLDQLVTAIINECQLIADIFLATYGMKITEKLFHEVLFGSRESK